MPREERQNWPLTRKFGLGRPIVIKFGVYLETCSDAYYNGYGLGTSARAHVQ